MSGTLGLQCRSYLTDVSACFTLLWQSCWPLDRFTGLLMPHMSTNQRGKPSESVQLFSCYDKLWLPKEQTHTRGSNAHTQWIRGQDSWLFLGPTQCVAAGFWLYSGRWQSIKHVTQRVIRAGSLFSQQSWGAAHLTAKTSVIYNGFQGRNNTLTNLKERTRN